MLTITHKLRAVLALGAVGAALASAGVASAATTGAPHPVVPVAATVTTTANTNVGSAGQPGWDDQACEDAAANAADWTHLAGVQLTTGDLSGALESATNAARDQNLVDQHCLQVDPA